MDAMDATAVGDVQMILCCQCGVAIPPNPINTCVNCLQTRYDIGAGVAKQVQQHTCRGCNRFERRDGGWVACEPESKELLALLLKKPRGLASVRLVDASFVWTEPHSKRIKLRVTIQDEVVQGAVLQQSFVIEYVIGNKQCINCCRREAKDTWIALVQVRQKVPHKRTFLWIEQLILKHAAHSDAVNIAELKDGIDFFFDQRSHAEKLVSFLQSICPSRYKASKAVQSMDTHTGKGKTKFTFAVEILPVCKDDLVWLPRATAASLGQISRLCLCSKVSNVVHLLDPSSLQAAELQPMSYWKTPFSAAMSRAALVEFVVSRVPLLRASPSACLAATRPMRRPHGPRARPVEAEGCGGALANLADQPAAHRTQVLDVELRDPDWRTAGRRRGVRTGRDAWTLADVTVARRSEFGSNDRRFVCVTHLGHLLHPGDFAWGYMVEASQLGTEIEAEHASELPEVILVKKSYSERRHRARRRVWKLRALEKDADAGVIRGRHLDTTSHEMEYEDFLQELEEDPSLRSQINMCDTAPTPLRLRPPEPKTPGALGTGP